MLADALESALLQDSNAPIEIVIVDNDPASTAQVLSNLSLDASRHDIRYYVNETNLGMFGNWNQAIALARGRWITLLHDDDWLSPCFVSAMLPLVQSGIDFAVCRVAIGNSNFQPAKLSRLFDGNRVTPLTLDDLVFGNPSPAPGILLTREVLLDVNGFDPATYPSGDYSTYSQCASRVPAARLTKTLAYYRITDNQTFKGDTLRTMINQSIRIKQVLLKDAHPASNLTYMLSMAFWFRLARQHHKPVDDLTMDWRLKGSAILSRIRILAFGLEMLRKGIKKLVALRIS